MPLWPGWRRSAERALLLGAAAPIVLLIGFWLCAWLLIMAQGLGKRR